MILLLIGVVIVVGLIMLAIGMFAPSVGEEYEICDDDIPCQECGKCYGDHIKALGVGHDYRYPSDLHR